MKMKDVEVGGRYLAKVSGEIVPVKILLASPFGGWMARNEKTGRPVRIRTAQRFRGPA